MSSTIVTRRGAQKSKIQTRSMKEPKKSRAPNSALAEAKKKGKQKMSSASNNDAPVLLKDIYHNAMSAINMVRGHTGIIFDKRMTQHLCLWDQSYPECPDRLTRVLERCEQLNLVEKCRFIEPRLATEAELLSKHTQTQIDLLKATQGSKDEAELEDLSSNYDAIFIHPTTYELSLLAVGSTIELVDSILTGSVQNGMAIIRPPGHHAMKAEFNGYCFFNNVAIAAQHALDKHGLRKILIVDWDVHHGQGTQQMFYDDPRVLYFSIHRYENGTFWPNLRESDFDCVGKGKGLGYNFNLPLNKIGMTNSDYLAIFQQILMPVAIEYQPELIIVSAGYDAALGCPEGLMEITPACYPHLLSPLLALAQGRVAVVLEGGYCLDSLAEGGALTLKTLLGDPCPLLMHPLVPPCDSLQESILNCIHSHRSYWKNLQLQDVYGLEELNNITPQPNFHQVIQTYVEPPPLPAPIKYATRDCYAVNPDADKARICEALNHLKIITNLTFPPNRVCYVYDDLMLEHKNIHEVWHPEQPQRILNIKQRHEEYKLFQRMKQVASRTATKEELLLAHSTKHVRMIKKTAQKDELREIGEKFNSVYFHPKTYECATVAAGSVLQVVDDVLNGGSRSGVCIVRPPGHHAESDIPHGFCIFNNVAVAAQYAIRTHGLKKVMIIDWDVHHGNGTQHIFENNPNVLYVSIHRYDNGSFFPKSRDADYTVVGRDQGEGFNVNVPWNKKGMGDMEYAAVFQNIIMPIAYEFNPELVLVSAGFDAAIGDPLGGCKVTPEAYGHFTHWLSSLANGKVIVCLEGGYNVNSISYAMTLCTKSLLGDPLPMLQISPRYNGLSPACLDTMRNVLSVQEKYWKSLRFHKKLPDFKVNQSDDLDKMFVKLEIWSSNVSDSDVNSSSAGSRDKSLNSGDENQAGPSNPSQKSSQTLSDYLAENFEALQNEEMFAVVPLKNCPHLAELRSENVPEKISTKSPCEQCDSTAENWVCLMCFKVFCGRYIMEHMMFHNLESEHPLVLSFSDISVWCYKCEAYIENPILHAYKNLVHVDKFGEELVWSYGSDNLFLDVV